MANYDNKLGEWYKQLEKKAQEIKSKKSQPSEPLVEQAPAATGEPRPVVVNVESPAHEAPVSTIAIVDTTEVVAEQAAPENLSDSSPSNTPLFGTEESPQVEDFFSFLNRTREPEVDPLDVVDTRRFGDRTGWAEPEPVAEEPVVEELAVEPVAEPTQSSSLERLSEGTGDPRPIASAQPAPVMEERAPVIEQRVAESASQPKAEAQPVEVRPAPAAHVVEPKETPKAAQVVQDASLQEKWDRMPHHLQVLFGTSDEEIAQNSYKPFRETRGQLIERLLDPTISLEETARILNVCPTTVRRYTNRGVLPHYRTAGNQRRFKLSDILSFMEHGTRGARAEAEKESASVN